MPFLFKIKTRIFFSSNLGLVCIHVRLQDHPHSGVRCGPHRTVRTAPALIGQKSPHHHDFRTFFEHYFQTSILSSTIHFSPKQKKIEPYFSIFEKAILSYKYLISVKLGGVGESKNLIMYTTQDTKTFNVLLLIKRLSNHVISTGSIR